MWQTREYRDRSNFKRRNFDAPFNNRYKYRNEYRNGNNWKNRRRSYSPDFVRHNRNNRHDRSSMLRQSHRGHRYSENRQLDNYHSRNDGDNSEKYHGRPRPQRILSPRSPSIEKIVHYDQSGTPGNHSMASSENADELLRIKKENFENEDYCSTDKDEGASTPNYEQHSKSPKMYDGGQLTEQRTSTPKHEPKISAGSDLQQIGNEKVADVVSTCVGSDFPNMRHTHFTDEATSTKHERYSVDSKLPPMTHVQMADARNRQTDVLVDNSFSLQSAEIIKILRKIYVIDECAQNKNENGFNPMGPMENTNLNVIAYPLDEQHFLDKDGYILNTMDVLNECERIGAKITSMCYKYVPIVTKITANIVTEFGMKEKQFLARKGHYAAHNELCKLITSAADLSSTTDSCFDQTLPANDNNTDKKNSINVHHPLHTREKNSDSDNDLRRQDYNNMKGVKIRKSATTSIAAAHNALVQQHDLRQLSPHSPAKATSMNSSITSMASNILPYLEQSPKKRTQLKSPPPLKLCPTTFSIQSHQSTNVYALNPTRPAYNVTPLCPLPPLRPPPPLPPKHKSRFFPPLPTGPLRPLSPLEIVSKSPPSPEFTPIKRKNEPKTPTGSPPKTTSTDLKREETKKST